MAGASFENRDARRLWAQDDLAHDPLGEDYGCDSIKPFKSRTAPPCADRVAES